MTSPFVEFLTEAGADSDTVQQAARYVLAQRTDYETPEEMLAELQREAGDTSAVDQQLESLADDPELLEQACLLFLADVWASEGGEAEVRQAIAAAKEKLPVIEISALAVVAMYALWLRKTGGVHKSERVVERLPDGTFRERETVEYFSPEGPLHAIALDRIISLFKRR